MKTTTVLQTFGTLAALAAAAIVYVEFVKLRDETLSLKLTLTRTVAAREPAPPPRYKPPTPPPAPSEATLELADVMTRLQLHANKLYFAGQNENWPLVDFYVEEIEETVKDIERRKNVTHEQINVSGLMPALLMPEVGNLETAVTRRDARLFQQSYATLIQACNACHQSARLPIVIGEPHSPALDNQRFEPSELSGQAGNPPAP